MFPILFTIRFTPTHHAINTPLPHTHRAHATHTHEHNDHNTFTAQTKHTHSQHTQKRPTHKPNTHRTDRHTQHVVLRLWGPKLYALTQGTLKVTVGCRCTYRSIHFHCACTLNTRKLAHMLDPLGPCFKTGRTRPCSHFCASVPSLCNWANSSSDLSNL